PCCRTPVLAIRRRRPPQSTRSPYATLFRSGGYPAADRAVRGSLDPGAGLLGRAGAAGGGGLVATAQPVGGYGSRAAGRAAVEQADRKSTRLNSSHVKIP